MHRSLLLPLLVAAPSVALAQAPAETLRTGHQLFTQSCAVCHLKPQLISRRYGPELTHDTVAGKEEGVRAFIQAGTPNMPGFRYELSPTQIDAIIAYLATIQPSPQPAAATTGAAPRPQGGMP